MSTIPGSSGRAATSPANEKELVITRLFNAPRELVWQAWTDPAHLAQWWGPEGFTARVEENDLRPNGRWRYVMIGPDGAEYPSIGVFREVVPFERIVSTDDFGDDFQPLEGMELPGEMIVTTFFESVGDKTRLTIRIEHSTLEDRRKHEAMGVIAGWDSTLDCLKNHLATMHA